MNFNLDELSTNLPERNLYRSEDDVEVRGALDQLPSIERSMGLISGLRISDLGHEDLARLRNIKRLADQILGQ